MSTPNLNIKNRKASFEYHLEEEFTAGIMLTGTEIKSVRESKASIAEAYCYLHNGELLVKNMHINIYEPGGLNNHEPRRERKLLLNRDELKKIEKALKVKGTTLIPLRLFINDRGYAKMQIALATGKKAFDKRDDIKEKDAKREMDRVTKERR
jgi:SsrA-binding protein